MDGWVRVCGSQELLPGECKHAYDGDTASAVLVYRHHVGVGGEGDGGGGVAEPARHRGDAHAVAQERAGERVAEVVVPHARQAGAARRGPPEAPPGVATDRLAVDV